jgi:hypothetical protein
MPVASPANAHEARVRRRSSVRCDRGIAREGERTRSNLVLEEEEVFGAEEGREVFFDEDVGEEFALLDALAQRLKSAARPCTTGILSPLWLCQCQPVAVLHPMQSCNRCSPAGSCKCVMSGTCQGVPRCARTASESAACLAPHTAYARYGHSLMRGVSIFRKLLLAS